MLELILIFIAFAGFVLAFYIAQKKNSPKPLICPLRSNCTQVITSDYSKFLGVPVERLGLLYYAFIALTHGFFLVHPELLNENISFILIVLSSTAFLFSLYLIAVQAFALKQWCTWCLLSAFFCLSIFLLTLMTQHIDLISVLVNNYRLIVILHLFAVSLGVGTATITDIFFFKFLKDFRISEEESSILHTFSQIIWFALGLLVLSGLGLFLPEASRFLETPKFLVKMSGVVVLIANGILLNIVIAPKLIYISFRETVDHSGRELRRLRKLAFASGAISFVSWYFVFIMGALRQINISFSVLMGLYVGFLIFAIIGSQVFEYFFVRQKVKEVKG